jgi:hypothetical protein
LIRPAALLAAMFLSVASPAAEHKSSASNKKTEDSFINGAPLSFEQVLKLAGQDAIPNFPSNDPGDY